MEVEITGLHVICCLLFRKDFSIWSMGLTSIRWVPTLGLILTKAGTYEKCI